MTLVSRVINYRSITHNNCCKRRYIKRPSSHYGIAIWIYVLTIFHCSHNYLRAFWASASTVESLNNDGIVTKGFQLFDGPIQTSLQRRISHEPHKTIFTSFVYSCITLAKTEIMYIPKNVRA